MTAAVIEEVNHRVRGYACFHQQRITCLAGRAKSPYSAYSSRGLFCFFLILRKVLNPKRHWSRTSLIQTLNKPKAPLSFLKPAGIFFLERMNTVGGCIGFPYPHSHPKPLKKPKRQQPPGLNVRTALDYDRRVLNYVLSKTYPTSAHWNRPEVSSDSRLRKTLFLAL